MERLSNLGALPVGDVRYHADDLPNGSEVNLDDSSWMTIQMRYIASAEDGMH
jgi:alpha-mannosidase